MPATAIGHDWIDFTLVWLCPWQDVRSDRAVHDGQSLAGSESIDHMQTTWEGKHTVIDSGLPPLAQDGNSKKQQPGDEKHHAKCRAAGFKFCNGCMLDSLRKRIKDAVRALCKATSILNEEASEAQQKTNIKKLMDGWWFLSFTGCPVDDGEGAVQPAVHYVHVSWVLGGLQQFFPVFARMEISDAALEASEQISMKFSGQFIDFYEFCAQLNLDWTWSVQRFELQSRASVVIGSFIAAEVSATRAQCPPGYMAWKGVAAYRRRQRRPQPRDVALSALSAIMDDVMPDSIGPDPIMIASEVEGATHKDRASDSGGSQADDGEAAEFDIELWGGEDGNQEQWICGVLELQEQEEEQQVLEMDSAVPPVEPVESAELKQPIEPAMEPEQPVDLEQPVVVAPPALAKAKAAAPLPRSSHDSLHVFDETGTLRGEIKYKPSSRDLFARCLCSDHHSGGGCFKTRTCNASATAKNPWQGRPLGFLAAWCCESELFENKQLHVKSCLPSKEARTAARKRLSQESNFAYFSEKERPRTEAEDSEPEVFG